MTGRLAVVALVVTTLAVVPGTGAAVPADNESPLADAGLDQQAERGENVHLDATGSRDPDGEISAFEWRIETPDGEVVRPACADCARTRFSVDQVGRYAVTVTVTDDDGATSTDTLFVDVEATDGGQAGAELDEGPSEVTAGTTSDSGFEPVSAAPADCVGDCADTTEPWIEIHGPSTVGTEEEVTFDVEYGGFSSEPQIGWSISGHGESATEEWNSAEDETIYATGATESETARDSHSLRVVKNKKPQVSISAPGTLHPGETIRLTADASDPDGYVTSIDWRKGPSIRVPENEGRLTASVTVTDNDDSTSIGTITITADGIKSNNIPQSNAIHSVYCYYDNEPERQRQSPDHCEIVDSDNSPDSDGYVSNTGDIDRMLRSPNYDVIWKKLDGDASQHSGNLETGAGVVMPDVVDNDGTSPALPSLDSSQRNAIRGRAVETNSDSFTLNGETVRNDLNGDGEINSEDWDERFGSVSSTDTGSHDEAVDELKESHQADRQARGAGGAAAAGSSTGGSSSTSSWSSSITSNHSGSSESTGDDSQSTTSGDVAADKGQRIANGGGMGMGMY